MAQNQHLSQDQFALLHAVQDMDVQAAQTLLERTDIAFDEIVDESGKGLLHLAVEMDFGDSPMLRALLDAGLDPNKTMPMGTTPLHISAQQGDSRKLHYLVKAGADINAQDAGEETPLHKCVSYSRREYAHLLMDMGADSTIRNAAGKMPHEYSKQAIEPMLYETLRTNNVPPLLQKGEDVTLEALTARKENRTCALDAGATWLQSEQWLAKLEQRAERLDKATLLQVGKNGKSYLERAIDFRMGEQVLRHLSRHGDVLKAEDLQVNGRPTILLEAIVNKGLAAKLFSEQGWKGKHPKELQDLYRLLPEKGKAAVPNYYSLQASLMQQRQKQEKQEDIGR